MTRYMICGAIALLLTTSHAIAASTSRNCLDAPTRDVLSRLEAKFGPVKLVSTCRPGARMPSGHVSLHARNKAFDFIPPKGKKGEVMVWLTHNSPGVTMSYRRMAHIHTDTGNFKKTIYAAKDEAAGWKAVAIWKQRAEVEVAALTPLPPAKPPRIVQDEPQQDWTAFLAASAFDYPEPVPQDIFRRYVESRDVVVKPWVKMTCPGGKDLPKGLQALLQDSGAYFGRTVYVNSAYRTPAYNRRVGGARQSQHMQCRAVDFRVAGVSPGELKRWIVANLPKWGITGLGTYATHTHADVGFRKVTRLVQWNGGAKRRVRYAKARKPVRHAAAI